MRTSSKTALGLLEKEKRKKKKRRLFELKDAKEHGIHWAFWGEKDNKKIKIKDKGDTFD